MKEQIIVISNNNLKSLKLIKIKEIKIIETIDSIFFFLILCYSQTYRMKYFTARNRNCNCYVIIVNVKSAKLKINKTNRKYSVKITIETRNRKCTPKRKQSNIELLALEVRKKRIKSSLKKHQTDFEFSKHKNSYFDCRETLIVLSRSFGNKDV